jgi:hypothetical protein
MRRVISMLYGLCKYVCMAPNDGSYVAEKVAEKVAEVLTRNWRRRGRAQRRHTRKTRPGKDA